ncbi:methionine synthase [Methanobrevibacter sp. OttesenSCG-928-I08]|nr:methionine synthase [Methanobrevibacter sp. OttesenSCG-928-I08]
MFTTVVGSYPVNLKSPDNFKDKLINIFGFYDPYKIAIKEAVISQLDAGIDVVSDGQVRGDMIGSFVKYIPGFIFEKNSSVIVNKIQKPHSEITTSDIKYAKEILTHHIGEDRNKGVKGIITGPSTIIHSSRIESFYKNKNQAILDLAKSLKYEIDAISKIGAKYIQIDEPFLSTGMVDIKTASEAINILSKNTKTPISIHVCGNLENIFKDLCNFNVDIIDCEFAGNNQNLKVLEDNIRFLENKKIGFGCVDTTLNKVDDIDSVRTLVSKGIELVGYDNLILDPDCGLKKIDNDIAFKKLQLINKVREDLG